MNIKMINSYFIYASIILLFNFNFLNATTKSAQAHAILTLPNSTILAGGIITDTSNNITVALARYLLTGAFDLTFGSSGIATANPGSFSDLISLAIDSNNNIVISGSSSIDGASQQIAMRFNSLGAIDTTFGINGLVNTLIGDASVAYGLVLQSDGKIALGGIAIIQGSVQWAVTRYNTDGSLDTTFGTDGVTTQAINFTSTAHAITIDQNGKIVTGGITYTDNGVVMLVVRLNLDGSFDETFNEIGYVTIDVGMNPQCYSLAINDANQIIVAGAGNGNFCLARLNSDGSPDYAFGQQEYTDFVQTIIGGNDVIEQIVIQSDDKIVAAGNSNGNVALVRYNGDGTLDQSFGNSGIVLPIAGQTLFVQSVALQADGNIVVAGYNSASFIITRYLGSNGSIDTTFGNLGTVSLPGAISGPLNLTTANLAPNAGITYAQLNLFDSILSSDINSNAAIADTQLATIQTAGKVANSATTATSDAVASTIMARDAQANVSVNTLTADGTLIFNNTAQPLNVLGSVQSGLKVSTGQNTTGTASSVTIDFTTTAFNAVPVIVVSPTNGSFNNLSLSNLTQTSATITSTTPDTSFNYVIIGD